MAVGIRPPVLSYIVVIFSIVSVVEDEANESSLSKKVMMPCGSITGLATPG